MSSADACKIALVVDTSAGATWVVKSDTDRRSVATAQRTIMRGHWSVSLEDGTTFTFDTDVIGGAAGLLSEHSGRLRPTFERVNLLRELCIGVTVFRVRIDVRKPFQPEHFAMLCCFGIVALNP
jgi:hypothetical protein